MEAKHVWNKHWSNDWNSWHVMKVTPCRSVGDTADVIPGVLSSKSSNSKFSESFKFSRYLRLGAWCHGWIMGCCVGWVLWVREVLGAVDSWVLLGVGAALTQREKEFGCHKSIRWRQIGDTKQSCCWWSLFWLWWKETAPRTFKEFNKKVYLDIRYLLQATTEKNKKRRYHKVFDLTLTMICDNLHRFPTVGARI